jgi:hypothetical protein
LASEFFWPLDMNASSHFPFPPIFSYLQGGEGGFFSRYTGTGFASGHGEFIGYAMQE